MNERPAGGRRTINDVRRRDHLPSQSRVSPTTSVRPPIARKRKVKNRKNKKRHILRWIIIIFIAVIIIIGGLIGYKVVNAASHVIKKAGNGAPALRGKVTPVTLKSEGDGRINILLLGSGGGGHPGANLSDTIMVASIDPVTKDVALLSLPRDLYVKIPKYGYGKLNAANAYGGPELASKVVSSVLDVPIDYYVQVDFSGFKQAVNSVGGIDINVASPLFDRMYPCDVGSGVCPYQQAAGQVHMNGSLALEYSRCRHSMPTGNCGDDTGRATRQQQVMMAIRAQALSVGTLTNPFKISGLIDTVGSHVTTNIQLSDMEKLATIIKDVDPSKIVNAVPQFSGPNAILTSEHNSSGDCLIPKAGEFNYTALQNLAHSIFIDNYIVTENVAIEVINGTGVAGIGDKVVETLQSYHYNVSPVINSVQNYPQTQIYDFNESSKPYTISYLQRRFNATSQKGTADIMKTFQPAQSDATTSKSPGIVIILGSNYNPDPAPPSGGTTK